LQDLLIEFNPAELVNLTAWICDHHIINQHPATSHQATHCLPAMRCIELQKSINPHVLTNLGNDMRLIIIKHRR